MLTATPQSKEVFVVDDDPSVRDALSLFLTQEGFSTKGFHDGSSFLGAARSTIPACVILDVHMPGRSGLDILKELHAQHYPAPIFILSGQADIPMAVDAIRNGAHDFIEKPFDPSKVVAAIREAVAAMQNHLASQKYSVLPQSFAGGDLLTPRERDVLSQIASGSSNKEAGRNLGISPRTIEVHRARIMEKIGAKNAADLMRIVLAGQE